MDAATPHLRQDYKIMVRAGNEVFGPGIHWIEEREAPDCDLLPATISTMIERETLLDEELGA